MRPHGGIIRRYLEQSDAKSGCSACAQANQTDDPNSRFHARQSMSDTISYADLKSAVLERRPHWRKQADMQQSAVGQPDAHRLGATLASRVFSWPRMRVAVARPSQMSAEKIAAPEHEDGIPLPIK